MFRSIALRYRNRRKTLQFPFIMPLAFAVLAFSVAGVAQERQSADSQPAISEDWFRPEGDAEAIQQSLKDDNVSDRWIYHDLDAARRKAQETGKPILALFRCVPCGSAPELDGALCTIGGKEAAEFEQQIRAAGGQLDGLLEQFVPVRLVKMNGVNRNVFRFDRDVPYVVMFLNADGTVYGRYGTRIDKDRRGLPRHRLTSLQKSMQRVLKLHADYPSGNAQLAGLRQDEAGPQFAEDLAAFEPFPERANPEGVKNCIHCHTVGEAEVRQRLADGPLQLRDIYPFPPPDAIGLKIDVDDGLKIESVRDDSPAAQAGLSRGDVLQKLGGQLLTSEADVQWVLHYAADDGKLPVQVLRGDRTIDAEIVLKNNWRRYDAHWRSTFAPLRPGVNLRPDQYRVQKGAKPGEMGLAVYYPRDAARDAGLRNGDLVVAVDGHTDLRFESDVLKYIYIDRPKAKTVEFTIIRNEKRSTITLPVR